LETTSKFDVRDYQRILTRRWWFIVIVAVCAGIIGVFISLGLPKTYRASATIVVPESPKGLLMLGGQQQEGQDIALETQALIAQGNQTAVRTAKALAERTDGPPIVVDPSEITADLKTTVQLPDLLRIDATSEDKDKAVEFANQTAVSFLEIMDELRQKQTTNATSYLTDQVEVTRKELEALITQRQQFQKTWGLHVAGTDTAQEAPTGTSSSSSSSNSTTEKSAAPAASTLGTPDMVLSLRSAQSDLAATHGEVAALRQQLAALAQAPATRQLVPNPAYAALQDQIGTSEVALAQLRSHYTDDHPAVREMQLRLQETQASLQKTPPVIESTVPPNPGDRATVEAQLRDAQQREAQFSARVAQLGGTVAADNAKWASALDKEGYLEELQDQIGLKRMAYQELLSQLESKKLDVASQRGQASMVDSALDAKSTAPAWTRTLVFSLALGLFLGFAMALLLEALDDTIRLPEDLTRDSDIRFLGIVPWTGDEPKLVMLDAPKSPPAEAFRTMRSNIRFATLDERAQIIMVTSAGASEGKSMAAANLAAAHAQAGEKVLIIDADLRRPTQQKFFDADATVGLTNVLVGEATLEQAIQQTMVPNLQVLTSGPLPPNPAELLDSPRMTDLLQKARGLADLIILDSPPAIMLTDALLLAARVDQILLIAAAGQVTRDAFDEMLRLLGHARGKILGVVLNKLKLTAGDYYYYYYYYYYEGGQPTGGGHRPRPGTPLPPSPEAGAVAPPITRGPVPPTQTPPGRDDLPF
jgi:capsular exopolysaccharide synthesis family protein